MSDEQDSLPALSPDGTCDVGRRIVFFSQDAAAAAPASHDAMYERASVSWDRSAFERCFGRPAELVDSSSRWWSDHVHPDDRLRVVSSLKRALFDGSRTARYWSESYRFKVYDGDARTAVDAAVRPAPRPAASSSNANAAPMISSGSSPTADLTPTEASTSAQAMPADPSLSPLSASRSPTPRQSSLLAPTAAPASSALEAATDGVSHLPERDTKNTASTSTSIDDSQYVTVLDQLYISRQPRKPPFSELPTAEASSSSPPTNSSSPHDRQQDSDAGLPTLAVGTMFALEQRIKTAEALQTPRSKLMRSISNLTASSNASSSNASNTAPSSSAGSFVSVPSSAGAMQRSSHQQQQQQQHLQQSHQQNQQSPSSYQLHPLSLYHSPPHHHDTANSAAAWNQAYSPTSPVSSPSASNRAFSFLDVEGVRTILENTQSGLTM